MMGDAAAQRFAGNKSFIGQVKEAIKAMLTALLGEDQFNKLMSNLNRGGRDLDMLTLADMDGVEMRSAFKRAVVDGKNINVGGKDIVFGKVIIDKVSLDIISGSTVDFKKEMIGESFVINNPKASSSCGCGLSFSV